MTYNRCLKGLDPSITDPTKLSGVSLSRIWVAGATGGLASWIVSAPSELVKCRTQLHNGAGTNSLDIFKHVWRRHGLQGLYLGGAVTSVRDSVGYGFYFSSYELCRRLFASQRTTSEFARADVDVLVSGGIAGIITWASIYPLDVVKTRIQATGWRDRRTRPSEFSKGSSAAMAKSIFEAEGLRPFYCGLTVCSVRAFFVNAIQVFSVLLSLSLTLTSCSGTLMKRLWRFCLPRLPRIMPPFRQNRLPCRTPERVAFRQPGAEQGRLLGRSYFMSTQCQYLDEHYFTQVFRLAILPLPCACHGLSAISENESSDNLLGRLLQRSLGSCCAISGWYERALRCP